MGNSSLNSLTDLNRKDIIAYIRRQSDGAGRKEMQRDLALSGEQISWLKSALNQLLDEGTIALNRSGKFTLTQTLPRVGVLQVIEIDDDGDAIAAPVNWRKEQKPPHIFVNCPRPNDKAPGVGDRILARLSHLENNIYRANIIRTLEDRPRNILGIYGNDGLIKPVHKSKRDNYQVALNDTLSSQPGELVVAEVLSKNHLGLKSAKIVQRLGLGDGPNAFSHIALHMHEIPHIFPTNVLSEAQAYGPVKESGRTDLRNTPLITIDDENARDFDDAIFAEPWIKTSQEGEKQKGWHLIIAIADVSWYVRPGSLIDQEARKRGTSVYFPDRVIPMLPEPLSNDWCSLKPDEDRPCLAAHIWINENGEIERHKFERAIMRSHARLNYAQVQQVRDGTKERLPYRLSHDVIQNLFAAYDCLRLARELRQPLNLVTSEPLVILDKAGTVIEIGERPVFDSHQMIEEFMICANIAAAITLENAGQAFLYRVHEEPPPDKLRSFREFSNSLGVKFPKGDIVQPHIFNRLLTQGEKNDTGHMISIAILRCQSQARYTPENSGHFGLALRRYTHFTSPIRRYPDLMVHRALIHALDLGEGAQQEKFHDLMELGEHFSQTERRAVAAERDTTNRFASAYFTPRIGEQFAGSINGVAKFGLFITLDGLSAEGLVPISKLPNDRYHIDEKRKRLIGRRTKIVFQSGQRLKVAVRESNPINGTITLDLVNETRQSLAKNKAK